MQKEDLDISDVELLEKLDLIVDNKLKRAGVLCVYRNTERIIGGCYIKIGKFEGSELIYQDEIHGSLLLMADRVIDVIYLKYLKAAISYHKETRVETYPFSREAIREAVFNALIHCNWADNVPVQIRIEDDSMCISNCSMLPFGWTAETLLGLHASKPYNPDIAKVFYRAGYIESWGRGIQKIRDACKILGTDEPEYFVHGEDLMVRFKALQSAKVKDDPKNGPKDDPKNGPNKLGVKNSIIQLMKENPSITIDGLGTLLSVSRKTIQRNITDLKASGKVERLGSSRAGAWKVND